MTTTSITDTEFKFNLLLGKGGMPKLKKSYAVTIPQSPSLNPPILEQNGYHMLDAIVEAILDDPEFKKAFFEN